ncbi:MAG: LuxR C-terminal-related transcriptional regulator [Chloroflexi bacterium]|nr:LuxR C-terminal-related transcriptional regulator [Chloroflexota bacterium]
MPLDLLATKLFVPPVRAHLVPRLRLLDRLQQSIQGKLTLISAGAGFGKSTLVSAWVAIPSVQRPVAWLSLDAGDSDPVHFLTYLVAALQTIAPTLGAGIMDLLQGPQPPRETAGREAILTTLINELTTFPDHFVLVLDDYHLIEAAPNGGCLPGALLGAVDTALTFLLDHLPPRMHLVIITREDPSLPLARLRARGDLSELRAADLRFTEAETAEFLNQGMGLSLSVADIAALEARTEGWIAGLQLAALSLQGQHDATHFIQSFTGSHHFVLDYLVEEVLERQPASVQTFLLRTSILDRLCGPLCDAVLRDPAADGQATLAYLEHANLFLVPLDNERRWYRYHHLFADLLRQRLHQHATSSTENDNERVTEYHSRASQWYEDQGLTFEAFQQATAAQDIERAARLIEGEGLPRHFRSTVTIILDWLASLPMRELDARPALWWRYASLLLVNGQTAGVEERLQASEAAMQGTAADDKTRPLIGQIAAVRAVLAVTRYQVETMLTQSRRALAYLPLTNRALRATASWTLGVAYQQQDNRAAAQHAFTASIELSQACGEIFTTVLATIGLADLQIAENQLYGAAETYQRVLQLLGDSPLPVACEAHRDLAQIYYEWNDLAAAERHGRQSLHLARQYGPVIDRFVICEVFLARLKLAQGDVTGAAALLVEASQSAHTHNFVQRVPEVAAVQVLTLLRQGNLATAAQLAELHDLPISQARVYLARGDPAAALAVLDPLRQQMEAKGWADERLKVLVLQAVAHQAHGEKDAAVQMIGDALALAKMGGFIRLFVDEGPPMARLLSEVAVRGIAPDYTQQLLAAFSPVGVSQPHPGRIAGRPSALVEPLSERELDVLRLFKTELSGPEIARELVIGLSTVRTHTKNIYSKLNVNSRRAAVKRAAELDLI